VLHSALVRLRQLREEPSPFMMCVSFSHPHDPFLVPQAYWDAYEHRDIPMPSAPPQEPESLHPYSQWIQMHHEIDRFPLTPEETRQARRAYYAAVTYVDELVGRLLAELRRLNLDDTMVIFTSDHGEMLGEHGMWFKRTFYDGAVKVPLIVSQPGVFQSAVRHEAVSLVDLTATLLDYGDVPDAHAHIQRLAGNSLRPLLEAGGAPWEERVISEYYSEGTIQPMLLMRTERFKFVYVHQHPPLLFDLKTDPLELHDLASHEHDQPLVKQLQNELLDGIDVGALRERIVRSQQERLLIVEATRAPNTWKYQATRDASRLYPRASS
jgi:choline-sulfatase